MGSKLVRCDLEGTRCRTCRSVIPVGDEMIVHPTGSRTGTRWWRQCLDCNEARNEKATEAAMAALERRGDILPESFAASLRAEGRS